jgi:hypothetical protein
VTPAIERRRGWHEADHVERHVRGRRGDDGAAALVDPRQAETREHHRDLQDQGVDRRGGHVVHQPERQRRCQRRRPEPVTVAHGTEQDAAEEELLADRGDDDRQHHEETLGHQGEARRHLFRNRDVVPTASRNTARRRPDRQTVGPRSAPIAPNNTSRQIRSRVAAPWRLATRMPARSQNDDTPIMTVADDRGEDLGLADRAVDHRFAQQPGSHRATRRDDAMR